MILEELLLHSGLSSREKTFIKRWARVDTFRAIKYGLALLAYKKRIKDPALTTEQINQAQMIRAYSVSSAVRYLEVIKNYRGDANKNA